MSGDPLEHLDRDGFVVLRDVLDADEIDLLRRAFAHTASETGTQHVEIDASTPNADRWHALCSHPAVCQPAAALLTDVAFDCHGRNPLPGYGQQGLHADAPARGAGHTITAVTAIWMLDEFTSSNGATRIVPGTHVRNDAVPRRYAQPDAHHPDEIIVTGDAGSLIVFNGHLWHSGTRNRSDGPRRAVQMTARRHAASAGRVEQLESELDQLG